MIIFLILLAHMSLWAKSSFDLSYGLQGRTLPTLGAELYADAGYNQLLWGKKDTSTDFLYGLIRPSLGVSSSGVINSVKGEIEFFPLSILGLSVGRQYMNSNFEFPFFDCQRVNCKGEYQRNFVESKLVLGYKGWIVMGSYKVDTMLSPSEQMPMADWRNVIIGEPGEEVQLDKKLLVAKVLGDALVGVYIETTQFLGSRELKESFAGIYQFRKKDTNYMIGAGAFHTDQEPMGLQFYFRIHQVAFPSLKLF
jgi:hypothetical protein